MMWFHNLLFDHFWGKIEITFWASVAGLLFNIAVKAGLKFLSDSTRIDWGSWSRAGDTIGTAAMWLIIPVGIVYLTGHNLHKYAKKRG